MKEMERERKVDYHYHHYDFYMITLHVIFTQHGTWIGREEKSQTVGDLFLILNIFDIAFILIDLRFHFCIILITIGYKGEKIDIEEKGEKLTAAAKDALAAFLVGGSDNLSFASTAEEAARESCRVGAKAIFTERIRGKLIIILIAFINIYNYRLS